METIVFIGANKSGTSREAIKISEELGFYTVLFTDRKKFLVQREEFQDVHQMIYKEDLLDIQGLKDEIKQLEIKGYDVKACVSLIDPFVYISSKLSEELGLVQFSTEAIVRMEDKTKFREALKDHPATPFYTIYSKEEPTNEFINKVTNYLPLVVKPPVSNGSKDVILTENQQELKTAITNYINKFPDDPILLEEYLNGPQYLVEVIVFKQTVKVVGVIEQEVTSTKRFIVTGYMFPARLSEEEYKNLEMTVISIIKKLGLKNGSCHLEIRLVRGEWKLIEINPRMSGGAMNQIILHGSGINLIKETIKLYLGEEPIFSPTKEKYVYTHFITVNRKGVLIKVTGKNKARQHEGVEEVYVKPRKGSILVPPMSMGDRYAYVLASANSPENAKMFAIQAAKEIRFFLEPI